MPDSALLSILMVAVAIILVLLVFLLLRRPDAALDRLRANQGQRIDAFGRGERIVSAEFIDGE